MKKFKIYHECLGDEPDTVEALDAEEAASEWVEQYESDSAEYPLLDRPGVRFESVEVEDENGCRMKFRVYGESRPHYWAVTA